MTITVHFASCGECMIVHLLGCIPGYVYFLLKMFALQKQPGYVVILRMFVFYWRKLVLRNLMSWVPLQPVNASCRS